MLEIKLNIEDSQADAFLALVQKHLGEEIYQKAKSSVEAERVKKVRLEHLKNFNFQLENYPEPDLCCVLRKGRKG
jgi:hypothetical protein